MAERGQELDRDRADAAGAAVKKHGLAGTECGHAKEIVPDGEERFGERPGLDGGQPLRDRQGAIGPGYREFRVAAAISQSGDPVAYGPSSHLGADRSHAACDFEARNVAVIGRSAPPALVAVMAVDAGGLHRNQEFARSGNGNRMAPQLEHLRSACARDFGCTLDGTRHALFWPQRVQDVAHLRLLSLDC